MAHCCRRGIDESVAVNRDPAYVMVVTDLAVSAHPATQCRWAGRHEVDACGL
jgi:hypothetical protein